MKRWLWLLLLPLVACSTLRNAVGPTEKFTATVCADGAVRLPCSALGTVALPTGSQPFVALVVTLAGPYLANATKSVAGGFKSCLFTTYPAASKSQIVVTATAICKYKGAPVTENVTLTLVPQAS